MGNIIEPLEWELRRNSSYLSYICSRLSGLFCVGGRYSSTCTTSSTDAIFLSARPKSSNASRAEACDLEVYR